MGICLPYDIDQIYAFYCSRYKDISFNEFLDLGYEEFCKKLSSIPESEPLYTIVKSRVMNIDSIKDKEERKYWRRLKKINQIPSIYLPTEMIEEELKKNLESEGKIFNG